MADDDVFNGSSGDELDHDRETDTENSDVDKVIPAKKRKIKGNNNLEVRLVKKCLIRQMAMRALKACWADSFSLCLFESLGFL